MKFGKVCSFYILYPLQRFKLKIYFVYMKKKFKYFQGIYVGNRIKHAQKCCCYVYVKVGRNSEKE